MGWYKHWFGTPYYALLYGHRDDADAAAWVDAIMGHWKLQRGSSLLDLACGRGRHVRHFVRHGLRVTGADISAESIAEAQVAVPDARFLVHDMRDAIPDARFDAITCLFTSLGYFDDLEDDRRVFGAVNAMLQPGGRFVLDFMNTPVVLRDLVAEEELSCGEVHFLIRRELIDDILVKRIIARDGAGEHFFEERVQALMPSQIEAMVLDSGLVIEDRTDGPGILPYDPSRSARFVLWARKPES